MQIHADVDLKPYTTFRVAAKAASLVVAGSAADIAEVLDSGSKPALILGGGSNILFTQDVDGLVLVNRIEGRDVVATLDDHVIVRFGAGESWHECVRWTVDNGWGGLENLALIPGTTGAAPMQNIGAYGVEQMACFHELTAMDRATGATMTFDAPRCRFGYRESVFKHELRDRMIITSVSYRLSTKPVINASYADVGNELASRDLSSPSIRDVFDAVVAIRRRKLPDPAVIGNAGSFFKNPVVDHRVYLDVCRIHGGEVPHYPQADGSVKVPAAWLIDRCGWKGYRRGDAGVHEHQALVIVNHGDATGEELLALSYDIQQSVRDRFGIDLEREVNVW